MSLEVEAIFQNGILKPCEVLPLREGQKVNVTVRPVDSAAKRFCGSVPWTRDPEELHRYLDNPDESAWTSRDV